MTERQGSSPEGPGAGNTQTGPSAASAAGAGAKNMGRQERMREPLPPTGTDPPIHRTISAANMGQDILRKAATVLPRSYGRVLLGTLLRDAREQCTDLSLPVAPVPPQRAD